MCWVTYTTWQSSQIHNAKIGVWGALRAPQTPIFAAILIMEI